MTSRAAAAWKLVALAVLGVVVFVIPSAVVLAVTATAIAAAGLLTRERSKVLRSLRMAVLFAAALLAAHTLLTSFGQGLVVAQRVATLIAAASVVSHTTSTSDMLDVVERALAPLRRLGVEPARVSLLFALTLRFVPSIVEIARGTRQAHRARGVERPGYTILAPLLVNTLRLGDRLSDALDARGVGDGA